MEFIRKRKRGQNKKVQRTWFSDEDYRIFWRREVYGVAMLPRFMATVRVVVPNFGQDLTMPDTDKPKSFVMWDFVDPAHHVFKTLKAATEACEKHKRLWVKVCTATGIRGVIDIFGKVPGAVPLWVRKDLPRKVYEVLTRPPNLIEDEECIPTECSESSPSDPIVTLPTSFTSSPCSEEPMANIHVSPVLDMVGPTTPTTRPTRLKAAATDEPSPVQPVKAAAKAPKKPAAKPTKKPSPASKRKPVSTKGSSKPAKKPSTSSRKSKSKP